jgi:hypothetical protein
MRNRHTAACLGSIIVAMLVLVHPAAVLAGRGRGALPRLEVAPGETKTIPTNSINEQSRIRAACESGPIKFMRGTHRGSVRFTCGDDPRIGELDCANKNEKINLAHAGWFCTPTVEAQHATGEPRH